MAVTKVKGRLREADEALKKQEAHLVSVHRAGQPKESDSNAPRERHYPVPDHRRSGREPACVQDDRLPARPGPYPSAAVRFGKSYRITEQAVEEYLGKAVASPEP